MSVKIATWNLCLGLKKKKEYVIDTLRRENIDICLLQEVDIPCDYPINILSSKDYKLEVDKSTLKSRCAFMIKNNINYTRRDDLESTDLSLCVIDINGPENYRLINCYRLFNPPNNQTQNEHFALQLEMINKILNNPNGRKIIIAGDFNLHPEEVEQIVRALAGTRNDLMLWIPPTPTYFSGEHTSTLDYMLTVNMPRALLHGFGICPEIDIGQHKAIEASLGSTQVEEEFDVWKKRDPTTPHACAGTTPALASCTSS